MGLTQCFSSNRDQYRSRQTSVSQPFLLPRPSRSPISELVDSSDCPRLRQYKIETVSGRDDWSKGEEGETEIIDCKGESLVQMVLSSEAGGVLEETYTFGAYSVGRMIGDCVSVKAGTNGFAIVEVGTCSALNLVTLGLRLRHGDASNPGSASRRQWNARERYLSLWSPMFCTLQSSRQI